jgi:hypothetical protein
MLGFWVPLAAMALIACGQSPPEDEDKDMSNLSADEVVIGGEHDRQFDANDCTQDCSDHDLGYAWAQKEGIADPSDCGGNSQSFIEGCMQYASEQ